MSRGSKPPQYLSQLAERTRYWLLLCDSTLVEIKDDAMPAVTKNVLLTRGLIAESETKGKRRVWRPTAAGRELIDREEPRYLAQCSEHGYTSRAERAMPSMRDGGRLVEAVSEAEQQRITAEARAREGERLSDIYIAERKRIEESIEVLEESLGAGDARVAKRLRNARALLRSIDSILKAA